MKPDGFYTITNAKIGSAINVSQYSKVMESKPFDYDKKVEKDFLNPKVTTVAEALTSPSKRRLSLSGRFEGVYENENAKRRILNITGNNATIAVKLWGAKTELKMPEKKDNVTIHGLEISEFRGKIEANSTSTTRITVEDEEEDQSAIMEGEVEAACFEESDSSIVIDGKCLAIDNFLLGQIFKEVRYVENVFVKVRQEAKRVEEIILICLLKLQKRTCKADSKIEQENGTENDCQRNNPIKLTVF
ncbi:unnamed protein product [Mytilus coruscus]|uniref:Uncharacterized protein n=1 Tax=Mytilus coruscus TaxID=42192 RepID=A0A6J8ALH3_MYTCO|nr:unnamed protein product [Mytilus coruscus]